MLIEAILLERMETSENLLKSIVINQSIDITILFAYTYLVSTYDA